MFSFSPILHIMFFLFVRRVHIGTASLRMAGGSVGELHGWNGAVAIRFNGLAVQKSHVYPSRGRVLGTASIFQFATPHRILSHTSKRA